MRNRFAVVVSLILALTSAQALAGKVDLALRASLEKSSPAKAMFGKSSIFATGKLSDLIIKSNDPKKSRAAIEAAGGRVRSQIGKIMTISIPAAFLNQLEQREEIEAIEGAAKLGSKMNSARSSTGVASVHAGSTLDGNVYSGSAYDGTNVIVGLVDSGLDYTRADFNGTDGQTRVQYLGFQIANADGTMELYECAHDQIVSGSCIELIPANNDSSSGHGSHVAGVAAGSDGTYTGVAPDADIIFVSNDYTDDVGEGAGSFSSGLLDGVVSIFKKADILDKPAVINLSQGTHIGAHDNTSLLEQGLNSAVEGLYADGGKSYGRAIVAAAGNERIIDAELSPANAARAGGAHAAFSVASGASKGYRIITLKVPSYAAATVDIWFGANQNKFCQADVYAYKYADAFDGSTSTGDAKLSLTAVAIATNTEGVRRDSEGNVVAVLYATDPADGQNGKPRALFWFGAGTGGEWGNIARTTATDDDAYVLDVVVRANGGTCSGDMWIEGGGAVMHFMKGINNGSFDVAASDTNGGGYAMGYGDNSKTVCIPATASNIIAVGSYLQEKPFGSNGSTWIDASGGIHDATDTADTAGDNSAEIWGTTIRGVSPFSSIGPTADGRLKPEVLAPGDPVISVLPTGFEPGSAKVKIDDTHYKSGGTSQASPHVAGIVALLFEKNNRLTAAQVKSAITGSASLANTIGKSSYEAGYGNVNAVAAVMSVNVNHTGFSGSGDFDSGSLPESEAGYTLHRPTESVSAAAKLGCGISPHHHRWSGDYYYLTWATMLLPIGILLVLRLRREYGTNRRSRNM